MMAYLMVDALSVNLVGAVGFEPTQTYWHCHSFTASLSLQGMRTHENVEFLLRLLVRILSTVSE